MKKDKILIAVFAVMAATTFVRAADVEIDFDGKRGGSVDSHDNLRSVSFYEKIGDTGGIILPSPVRVEDIDIYEGKRLNLDYSILNTIDYCERTGISQSTVSGFKKLLAFGTQEEKLEFINSPKYVFPRRFANFGDVNISFLSDRNNKNECHKVNCRIEEVCGMIESCKTVSSIICAASAGALAASLPPTGWFMGAAYATGGEVCAKVGEKICKDIKDCKDVEKCDIVCDSDGNPCHTTSTGAVQCQ